MQFSEKVCKLAAEAELALADRFAAIDRISFENTARVMDAFSRFRVSESLFQASSGYGNGDRGRDVLDELWADVMGAEAAFVRHNIVSGTHALTIGLYGLLRPNDILYSIAGKPYDTLEEVIGICGEAGNGSLKDFGVEYLQTDLNDDGTFRTEEICENLKKVEEHYGIKPIIYASSKYKKKYLDDPFFKEYPSWVAHYYIPELREGEEWLMWQCTDLGVLPGIKEKVDINIFNGSKKQFNKLLID